MNKVQYDMKYIKEHKKKFQVDLNIDEYDVLEKELAFLGVSKVDFVRTSKERLEKDARKRDIAFSEFWNELRQSEMKKEEN